MQSLSPRHIFLTQALAYCGTLPLVAAILAQYLKLADLDVINLARCYVALVTSFICGIHWAVFLFFSTRCHHNMLISSSGITLMIWASLILPDEKIALVMQSLSLLYLLMIDYRLRQAAITPNWYYALRHNATAIVVFCLVMLELA